MSKKSDLLVQAQKEADFFDKLYEDTDLKHSQQNYIIPDQIIRQFTKPAFPYTNMTECAVSFLGELKNKRLLDYGAGDGWTAISFAKAGADVFAIDISERGIDLIRKKASANGVQGSVKAEVRDCYNTGFKSDEFDIVFAGGVLHHLEIESAGKELCRILKPNGIAVFTEPIRETKIMDTIKKVVLFVLRKRASEVTENEEPLNLEKIKLLSKYFKNINLKYFDVLASADGLISSKRVQSALLKLDYILINYLPGFKKLARAVVIEAKEPIKFSNT